MVSCSSQCKSYFITELTKVLDKCRSNFENIALRDFIMESTNNEMTSFMSDNDFINIIKSNSCFKTSTGTYIDLVLKNKPKSFQNTGVIETGVSYHHVLIFSFLKISFIKMPPNKLQSFFISIKLISIHKLRCLKK